MKKLHICSICIMLLISQPVFSGPPGEDFPQLGARILLNLTKLLIQNKRMSGVEKAMDYASQLKEMNIEAVNNAWSNVISRTGIADIENQHNSIKIKSQPALNVCGAFTASITAEVNLCDAVDEAVKFKVKHSNVASIFGVKAEEDVPESDRKFNSITDREKAIIDQITNARPDYIKGKNKQEHRQMYTANLSPTDASILMTSQPQFSTISEEDANTVSNFIYLISPPFEKDKSVYRFRELDDEIKIELLRDMGFHSIASESLFYALEKRLQSGVSGGSYLNAIERYAGKIYGPESDTVSTAMMTSNLATPTAIYRNMALMRSNHVKTSLEEFKQGLRYESLLANYLMTLIEY